MVRDAKQSVRADRVIVSAQCYFRRPTASVEALSAKALKGRTTPDSGKVLTFSEIASFAAADADIRQAKFEDAIAGHLDAMESAGVTGEDLAENNGEISLSISLCPVTGQAGIVLPPGLFSRLKGVPLSIYVDALR